MGESSIGANHNQKLAYMGDWGGGGAGGGVEEQRKGQWLSVGNE